MVWKFSSSEEADIHPFLDVYDTVDGRIPAPPGMYKTCK